VGLKCALTNNSEEEKAGKEFIKEILLNNTIPEQVWKSSLVVLIGTLRISPGEFITTQLGDMLQFFMEEVKTNNEMDEGGGNIDEEEDEDEGDDDAEFFRMGTTRLLMIVIECILLTPPSDLANLFSATLTSTNPHEETNSPNLIGFINCCAQSSQTSIRIHAFQAILLATKKSPNDFAPSAVKVFSTSATRELDVELKTMTTSLAWECLSLGGANSFDVDILETIGEDGGSCFTLDAAFQALDCLIWPELLQDHRADLLISLVGTCYVDGDSPLPSLSERVKQLLAETVVSDDYDDASARRQDNSKVTTFIESMGTAVLRASSLVIQDSNFDLEHVLCGTAPPCHLRHVAEFLFSEINNTTEFLSAALATAPQSHNIPEGILGEMISTPNQVWSLLCDIVSDELMRTDQQGYAVVVVQWLLGIV